MASKQLGKLRQWAGEVISTREKTQPSGEFMALEQEMETRKKGLDRLHLASRDYLEYISEKKQSEVVPGEPIMQSEALGVVMIGHGEELGDASALGRSLASFGRARCQIATMQNIYAVTLTDTFLAYLERSRAKLDDYFSQRKKLESRRLAYDAAIAKAEKTYKKEKDKKEAEEELARAKARYEEMAEDVTARMDAIREGEVEYQRELRNFLGTEMRFVEQYLEVLRDVEADWPESDSYADLRRPTSSFSAPHNFSRTSTRSTDSKDSTTNISAKFDSHRSNRSIRSTGSKQSASARSAGNHENQSESEDDAPHSRASSRLSRKASTKGSRTPSRLSKRHSRSGSVTTIGISPTADGTEDADSTKANGKHKKASGSVASWVGDAMSNVMSRNKSKNPDVGNFAALGDDEDDGIDADNGDTRSKPARRLSNRSEKSNRSANGKDRSRSRTRETARRQRKVMKAIHDFSGSSDELSFKAGEEIVVINEVLDDWWLGETGGRKGLFPANYTIFFKTVDSPLEASTKFKNASNTSILGFSRGSGKLSSEDEESRRTLVEPSESEFSATEDEHERESIDGWHPFDDSHRSAAPSGLVLPSAGETHSAPAARHGNEPFLGEDDFNQRLSISLSRLNVQETSQPSFQNISPVKRMPPPPPPRRQTTNSAPGGPPPLPFRNVVPSRTHSSSIALHSLGPPIMDRRAHSETSSPFESQSELSFDEVATTKVNMAERADCVACGCDDFVEDPFRGHGLCANCTHEHI